MVTVGDIVVTRGAIVDTVRVGIPTAVDLPTVLDEAAMELVPRRACLSLRRWLLFLRLEERRALPLVPIVWLLDDLLQLDVSALSSRLALIRRAVARTANNLFMSILYK